MTTRPTKKEPPIQDPLAFDPKRAGPVLLSDQIEYYCDRNKLDPPLIEPFLSDNLKPARYNLRIGSEAHLEGKHIAISENQPLVLQPHQVAIVQTFEEINLPCFLIARWNLRVDMVYEGLLWVGALQVDPGWQGRLPCPIYNLANRPIELQYKQNVFSMDFVRTTPFNDTPNPYYPYVSKKYGKPQDFTIGEHDKNRLTSAVGATNDAVRNMQRHFSTAAIFGITSLAVLFAALGVLATSNVSSSSAVGSTLAGTAVPISAIALCTALIAVIIGSFAITRESHPIRRRSPYRVLGTLIVLALSTLGWGIFTLVVDFLPPHSSQWIPQWILMLPAYYAVLHVVIVLPLLVILGWEFQAPKARG